jgi:hypothetical protein
MTAALNAALSHVLFATVLEGRLAAIAAAANHHRPRPLPTDDRRRFARLRTHRRHVPCAGGPRPYANHSIVRITCANLVAADENFIRQNFYLITKLKIG